jgi:hypothetical protein
VQNSKFFSECHFGTFFVAAMPNLSQVYSFIGNMVDPETTRPIDFFIEKLKQLDPVTLRAVRKIFLKHLCSSFLFDKWCSKWYQCGSHETGAKTCKQKYP